MADTLTSAINNLSTTKQKPGDINTGFYAFANALTLSANPKTDQTCMAEKTWYGARTVYDSCPSKQSETKVYEERIVVLLATSFDEAIETAEKEAKAYANEAQMKYLGFVNVYQIFDESIENGTEVYSLMRESNLNPTKYIDTFFDTGSEKTQ